MLHNRSMSIRSNTWSNCRAPNCGFSESEFSRFSARPQLQCEDYHHGAACDRNTSVQCDPAARTEIEGAHGRALRTAAGRLNT
jgi:hypothetical protein